MKKKRKFYQLILANMLLVAFFALFVTFLPTNALTGQAISITTPSSCNQDYFQGIWDQIFDSSFNGTNFSSSTSYSTHDCTLAGYDYTNTTVRYLVFDHTAKTGYNDFGVYSINSNLTESKFSTLSSEELLNLSSYLASLTNTEARDSAVASSGEAISIFDSNFQNPPASMDTTYTATEHTLFNYTNVSSRTLGDRFQGWEYFAVQSSNQYERFIQEEYVITDADYWSAPVLSDDSLSYTVSMTGSELVLFDLDTYSDNWVTATLASGTSSNPVGDAVNLTVDDSSTTSKNSGGGGVFSIQPVDNAISTWDFNYTISSYNGSTTLSVHLIVANTSAPEKIKDFDEIILIQGETETYNLEGYFTDSDTDDLDYTITQGDGFNYTVSNDLLKLTGADDFEGDSWIEIVASDGTLNVSSGKVDVLVFEASAASQEESTDSTASTGSTTVENTSIAIITSTPEGEIIFNESKDFTLFVEANDTEGKNLTYTWYVNGVKVNGTESMKDFSGLEPGEYEIKVEISNGEETVTKNWSVSMGGSSIQVTKWILIAAGVLFLLATIITFVIITKDMQKRKIIKAQQAPLATQNFGNNVPTAPINPQTNQQTPQQTNQQPPTPTSPVDDYLKKLNS